MPLNPAGMRPGATPRRTDPQELREEEPRCPCGATGALTTLTVFLSPSPAPSSQLGAFWGCCGCTQPRQRPLRSRSCHSHGEGHSAHGERNPRERLSLFPAHSAAICSSSPITPAEVGDVRRDNWGGTAAPAASTAPRGLQELAATTARLAREGRWDCAHSAPSSAERLSRLHPCHSCPAGDFSSVLHRSCVQPCSSSLSLALFFGSVLTFIIPLMPAGACAHINVLGSQSWAGFLVWAENS